jgi:hypothetical protein
MGPGQNLLGSDYNFCQKSGPVASPPAPPTPLTTQGQIKLFTGAAKVQSQEVRSPPPSPTHGCGLGRLV